MLSQDIDNAAASISNEIARVSEGGRISLVFLRGLQSNLRAQADQVRQIEAQIAPGSVIIDNVTPLRWATVKDATVRR